MKQILFKLTYSDLRNTAYNIALLLFRIAVSVELIVVHGLKKLGVGQTAAEVVPNPLDLPVYLNQLFATAANIVFPLFIVLGMFTRLATLPILAVTLTGYFVVHGNDSLLERDIPFMFSISFLLLTALGPGRYSIDFFLARKLDPQK